MGRRAAVPIAGERKRLPVKLSDELAVDLWTFCELHHGVAHNRIVEKAVRKFIDDELASDGRAQKRFEEIRETIRARPSLHVVRMPPSEGS
jgi:hypothetical protein